MILWVARWEDTDVHILLWCMWNLCFGLCRGSQIIHSKLCFPPHMNFISFCFVFHHSLFKKFSKYYLVKILFIFYFILFVHLFTCAYIVWVISPPCPPPPPFPCSPPQFQAGPVLPLWLILLKKRHKNNKKDKAFLLVELRRAIQKDSYYRCHVPMCYDPCWFNSNWCLSHSLNPFLWLVSTKS
jgi:hypothetical protein